MTEQEIFEGNRLIGEFMGFEINIKQVMYDTRLYYNISSLKLPTAQTIACVELYNFDRSWDWLMPVIEKIEKLVYTVKFTSSPTISGKWYLYNVEFYNYNKELIKEFIVKIDSDCNNNESRISTYFRAVIEFIKHYNSLNK